jgi:hypothetical protein
MYEKFFINRCSPVLVGLLTLLLAAAGRAEPFSFAILADPHVPGGPENRQCLQTAVDWIIANRQSNKIELVFVLGDIAWGGSDGQRQLADAKTILDPLNEAGIPYVPIPGDNEVQSNSIQDFAETFQPQLELLAKSMNHFTKAAGPEGLYLQNFSFDYKDCHFICPDFLSRQKGHEGNVLHAMEGGTWPWFQKDVESCPKPKKENIIILTHIGLYTTGVPILDRFLFTWDDMKKIKDFLLPYRDNIADNYAGHIHQNWQSVIRGGPLLAPIYTAWMTDETWFSPPGYDHAITVRWVEVDTGSEPDPSTAAEITYRQHLENVAQ